MCVSLKYFTHFYKTITVVLSSRFFLPVLLKAGYCIFQYEPFNNFCFHLPPMNINHHLGFMKHLSKLLALVSCYTSVYPSKRFQSRHRLVALHQLARRPRLMTDFGFRLDRLYFRAQSRIKCHFMVLYWEGRMAPFLRGHCDDMIAASTLTPRASRVSMCWRCMIFHAPIPSGRSFLFIFPLCVCFFLSFSVSFNATSKSYTERQ